jgi:hypothetical protein
MPGKQGNSDEAITPPALESQVLESGLLAGALDDFERDG